LHCDSSAGLTIRSVIHAHYHEVTPIEPFQKVIAFKKSGDISSLQLSRIFYHSACITQQCSNSNNRKSPQPVTPLASRHNAGSPPIGRSSDIQSAPVSQRPIKPRLTSRRRKRRSRTGRSSGAGVPVTWRGTRRGGGGGIYYRSNAGRAAHPCSVLAGFTRIVPSYCSCNALPSPGNYSILPE
jgi:hypothetical protein